MFTVIIVLAVIVAFLLIGIVLIQESKGGGLASAYSSSNQLLGVRKTTDFVEKATWTLAGLMVLLSIVSAHTVTTIKTPDTVIQQMQNQPVQQGGVGIPTQSGNGQAPQQ